MPWAPDYIDADVLKEYLYVEASHVADDATLAVWCTAASRAIDARCGRQFGQLDAPAVRTYRRPAAYDVVSGLWLLQIDDVQDVDGMTVDGLPLADAGAVLLPDDAPIADRPYTALGFEDMPGRPVTVLARWGWRQVPQPVVGAALLQANRWNARRAAPFGVAGSPDQGSEVRLLSRLDPDVAPMLAGLIRPRRVG